MSEVSHSRLPRRLARPLFRWSLGILGLVVGGLLVFHAWEFPLLGEVGMPHEFCYVRDPRLIGLHAISDLLIGLGYVSISATLGYLVYKASQSIPFNWVFLAFGIFIISCGFTHFMEVWVIWQPVYWLSGFIKVVTAAASVATALALYPLLPRIFRLIESAQQSEQRRAHIEQLNDDLARFNYSVAHDLRAPLRGIAGYGQALREDFGKDLPPQAMAYLDRIQVSVDRMDALIRDLLAYSKIGQQDVQVHTVPLGDAVRAALELLGTEISRREAEVVVDGPLPTVRGDPTLLQVVVQNLVANGIKFVAPGKKPRVEISAVSEGETVVLSIQDNGLGIPEEAKPRLFGMFERFHLEYAGTGIGLAIVQRATERLHGQVGFESPTTGGGTRFWVRLPAGDETLKR